MKKKTPNAFKGYTDVQIAKSRFKKPKSRIISRAELKKRLGV